MGDLLESGQEMDKTVRPKAKADNTSVCGVPGRYRMVSELYNNRKWMDIPANLGGIPRARPSWPATLETWRGVECPARGAADQEKEGAVR